MIFCPHCCNVLVYRSSQAGLYLFVCPTCPYKHDVTGDSRVSTALSITDKKNAKPKAEVATEMTTTVICPKCSHDKAVFNEMQTRSADEPMTIFYRCQKCGHNWTDR